MAVATADNPLTTTTTTSTPTTTPTTTTTTTTAQQARTLQLPAFQLHPSLKPNIIIFIVSCLDVNAQSINHQSLGKNRNGTAGMANLEIYTQRGTTEMVYGVTILEWYISGLIRLD